MHATTNKEQANNRATGKKNPSGGPKGNPGQSCCVEASAAAQAGCTETCMLPSTFTGTQCGNHVPEWRRSRREVAHHEGEDAEVDEEREQEHTHGANNMVQERYLLPWVEEHLVKAPKVHCTD
jgi:hypothetical protein